MPAHADDLRHFYAETLGAAQLVAAVTGAAVKVAAALPPGRYQVRFYNVVGASIVWCRQGPFATVVATKAVPSTPIEVSVTPRPTFTVMSRNELDGLSFITDAGTCSVAITKISYGKN